MNYERAREREKTASGGVERTSIQYFFLCCCSVDSISVSEHFSGVVQCDDIFESLLLVISRDLLANKLGSPLVRFSSLIARFFFLHSLLPLTISMYIEQYAGLWNISIFFSRCLVMASIGRWTLYGVRIMAIEDSNNAL